MNSVRSTEVSKSSNKIWQFECLKVRFMSHKMIPLILLLISLCAQCSEHFCMIFSALQGQYWFSVAMDLLILMECATSEALSCLPGWQWRERRGEADLQIQWEAWTGPSISFWKTQGIDEPIAHNVAWPIDCTCTYLIFIIHMSTLMTWLWPCTVFIFLLSLSKSTSL